ncbi:PREDICTED: chaperone protein dnaJ 15-like [Fragaria vesca subsp. vesca]|uniref:chaperone protein dnaJ 15-like n=1 Tax=Fragaria vesca subsp. vesca TaxID=101020 RepID=UPI0002C36030|nr:PREDICTED: chaperone protein dnaJ 15-like [Fragaria vesca subsp. vesca]
MEILAPDMKTDDMAIDAEHKDIEVDLSKLGAVNTMLAALFCKLVAPIKTIISGNVFEDAQDSNAAVRPLPLGTSVTGKVRRQCAHYFGVTISEQQAKSGIVVRVTSYGRNRFKLLYLEQDANNAGYRLVSQEDSKTISNVPSAGMYFLHFQVYRMDSTLNAAPAAFFKSLEGVHPCEVSQLKAGTHIFAVYGDNFFKKSPYKIEALCVEPSNDKTHKLREVEAQILKKRDEIHGFETEFKEALANFQEVTNRYPLEKQSVDELLKQRDDIYSSYTVENN